MFTPEGYWSWSETVRSSSEWTLEILAASLAPELSFERLEKAPYQCRQLILQKLLSSKKVENIAEAQFSLDLLELWVLANFMDTFEAVLCSPEGRTLRCPPLLKAHGDAFDWWVWPLSKTHLSHGEAYGYFKAFHESNFQIEDAQARFCAIDYETGNIQLKPNTISLLGTASYGHSASNNEVLRFIDQQIRPIIGWSICWNPDALPGSRNELLDRLGFGELDWDALGVSKSSSRLDISDGKHVLECVMSAFPIGKGGETWAVVESKVGYSRRTIIRALKQNGVYSDWAGGGQKQ